LSGFWNRSLAFVLAYFVIFSLVFPISHPEFLQEMREFSVAQASSPENLPFQELLRSHLEFQMEHETAIADAQFLFMVVVWLYFALSELLMQGSTLSKKTFKLKVVDAKTLKNASPQAILMRNFLKVISFTLLVPLLMISLFISFFNRERRAGHDWAAGTRVIRDPGTVPEEVS
jgi:uncharacterized RDD family membrane protein YckC